MNKDRQTVLLITPGGRTAPGGITRMVDYCITAWPQTSVFDLQVMDSYGPGSKLLMPFYALCAFLKTFWLLLMGRVQILHINFSERLSLWRKGMFVLLGNCFHVPVILHQHGAEFVEYINGLGPKRRALATAILHRAQKLIVLGAYWQDFMVHQMHIAPEKIAILYNAVPDIAAGISRTPHAECRIIFLGVIGERKGVPQLVNALAEPEMAALNWHMTIAGNGAAEIYRQKIQHAGLGDRVDFPGLLNATDAREALMQSDVFVLPSRQEGLPMAILEALSCGCPVVATPVGSITSAVIDGQTGIIVPVDDHKALARALAKLVASTEYRQRLGTQARHLFEEKFAINAYDAALENIYRQVSGK